MITVTTVKVIWKFKEIALIFDLGEPDTPQYDTTPQLEAEQLDDDIFTDQGIILFKTSLCTINHFVHMKH